ncbi:MAG: OmpA family protein [Chlorobi bacterium]|nr:OmpA family protein [Chlorobiota bacterium]
MKRLSYFGSFILVAAFLSGCGGLNKMKKDAGNISYQVTPKVLEAHGGKVAVSITGQFPEKYFNKNAIVEATPVLVYEGGETAFPSVTLQGEKVEANNKSISFAGGKFDYSGEVDFKDAMRVSELMLRVKASMKGTSVDFDPVKLADGVIATSTLVMKMPKPIFMKDNFKRIIPEDKMADINFIINRYNLRKSELKAEDVQALLDFVKAANEAPNMEFTSTEIHGYASPDGKYDFNAKLSQERADAVDKYMQREYKRAKVEAVNKESFISEKSTAEDWDGFKKLLENSTIKDKDLILRVLSMYSDPEVREKEIRNMAEAFEVLKKSILPELRRSQIQVNVNKIGFSDEEILNYIESNPDTLGIEEMLYAATLTDDAARQLKFYQTAFAKYPQCIRAANNVGATFLKMGKVAEAKDALMKAKALKDIDIVKNNLGFCELLDGNLDKATEYFTSMQKPTPESNFGLGTIAIIKGNYQDAVNFFGNEPSLNNALAKLLNDDATGAKNLLDGWDHECKHVDYLKAVIGARLGNEDYMFNNLKLAVQKDAKMKDQIKTDMEFGKYFENDTFKSIVE